MRSTGKKLRRLFALILAAVIGVQASVSAFAEVGSADLEDIAVTSDEWDGTVATGFAGGTGTEEDPYQIATGEQLAYLAQQVNTGTTYEGQYLTLTADILLNDDLENEPNVWTPIGKLDGQTYYYFQGTFDGAGHKIVGMYIESMYQMRGVFGCVGTDGTIKDFSVDGFLAYGSNYIGGVCGYNYGTISNCHSAVNINNDAEAHAQFMGGICGYNLGDILDCTNSGEIVYLVDFNTISSSIGGICGINYGEATISGCSNTAKVSLTDAVSWIGGICGRNYNTIEDSYNTAAISGGDAIGGICGYSETGFIQDCYNTGKVTGRGSSTGGICGNAQSDDSMLLYYIDRCYNTGRVWSDGNNAGGICGSSSVHITKCYNTGDVDSSVGRGLGGICGNAGGLIGECYNTGRIWTTNDGVGGIAGYLNGSTIQNCYNEGLVMGVEDTGGIWGSYASSDETIKNCYNVGDVIGDSNSEYPAGHLGTGVVSNLYYDVNRCTAEGLNTLAEYKKCIKTTEQLTASTALTDLGFDSSVWTKKTNANGKLYYPDLKCFADDEPCVEIPAVKNLTASASDGKVSLTWEGVDAATKYVVKKYANGAYSNVATVTDTYCTATGLTNGTKYGFIVQAYVYGAWTSFGVAAEGMVYATPVSSVPKISKATAGDGKVTLTWNAVSGATQYIVKKYVNGAYSNVATVTGTSCVATGLTNGTKYGFIVQAYANGAWTPFATASKNMVYATPAGTAIPVISTATAGDSKVTLTWNAVSGATQYIVKKYVNGAYSNVATVTGTSCVATGLTNGTKYGFIVQAYVSGAWTPFATASKNMVYATPAASAAVPVISDATAGDGQVTLAWNAVGGATQYIVKRYVGGAYYNVATVTGTSCTATGLTNGTKYGFIVQAYANGAWTPFATAVSNMVYATPVSSKIPMIHTMTKGNYAVTLEWNAVSGATLYMIKKYVDGEYYTMDTMVASSNTSYMACGLEKGVEYGFIVQACVNGAWTQFATAVANMVYVTL